MNVPVLRVKKVRYPEKKSVCRPKKSKTRQKKMSELDPFFNDEALVKGITKDSRRLRPYGTVCVMPKCTSAIGNELVYCGTKSPLGMCNRKGTSTETSCRGLWIKHISPDEQSLFVTNLRTLPSDDGQQRVQVHGHGAGKSSSNPLPVDRCPHAISNFPSLVFLKKHDCVYTSSFFVCL